MLLLLTYHLFFSKIFIIKVGYVLLEGYGLNNGYTKRQENKHIFIEMIYSYFFIHIISKIIRMFY